MEHARQAVCRLTKSSAACAERKIERNDDNQIKPGARRKANRRFAAAPWLCRKDDLPNRLGNRGR